MKPYHKLVRDAIPDLIRGNGDTPVTRIASAREYRALLRKKLREETEEFLKDSKAEELADILEVVYALSELQGVGQKELEALRRKKKNERGGFSERIILERTSSPSRK